VSSGRVFETRSPSATVKAYRLLKAWRCKKPSTKRSFIFIFNADFLAGWGGGMSACCKPRIHYCSLTDGRIISSRQSVATSEIVKRSYSRVRLV